MLSAERLTVSYPSLREPGSRLVAVDEVNISVSEGEIVGLVGESGCGKSTLARTVVGLQPADSGTVLLRGVNLESLSGARQRSHRRIAQMVFQNPFGSLDPHRTIASTISEALAIHGAIPRRARQARTRELLAMVGIDPHLDMRRPRQLSGGQCQRVIIARVLAVEPRLLVCDEPVTALDVSVQAKILNLIMELRDRLQMACLFITHDLSVLASIADRIAVMDDGRIVEEGAAAQILGSPKHSQTKKLQDALPEFSIESTKGIR